MNNCRSLITPHLPPEKSAVANTLAMELYSYSTINLPIAEPTSPWDGCSPDDLVQSKRKFTSGSTNHFHAGSV